MPFNRTILPCLLAAAWLGAGTAPAAGGAWTVVWVDGTQDSHVDVVDWGRREGQPTAGGKPLFDAKRPARWLVNPALERAAAMPQFVEFAGGDRLPGRVLAYERPATENPTAPPHLLVVPSVALDMPGQPPRAHLRVLPDSLRRIVWDRRGSQRYQPGTLFYRDGRQTTFRSLRWNETGVRLLVEQGATTVAFDQIAELHLPLADSWELHVRRLATLAPALRGRLMQVETSDGLAVTTSLERCEPVSTGDPGDARNWIHKLRPAWSLDPLFVPHRVTRSRTFFGCEELPLSWIEPAASSRNSALGGGWKQWQANANVQGGALRGADREFAWGFGVHAQHTLEFNLPPWARALRTLLALDASVGEGGCVRGRIWIGATDGTLLYEGPLVVGAAKPLDTGRLELPVASAPQRLLLVADDVRTDYPPGADPLDVRDVFNWLEPLVELDPTQLKLEVARLAQPASR